MAFRWQADGYWLAMGYLWAIYWLTIGWLSGYGFAMDWLWLSIGWLLAGYWLGMGSYGLAMGLLLAIHGLAMA